MKVEFRLRRRPECGQAVALLLPSRDVAGVLGLCVRLGLDPVGRIHDVAGGFLLRLDDPTTRAFPGVVRLRELAEDLFLPVDAELIPALLDDEAEGLTRDRGLIILPAGIVLGFDPGAPVGPAALMTGSERPRRRDGWRPLPDRPPLAERIEEIVVAMPDESPESVLDAGAGPIGTEEPRPDASGPGATLLGGASLGAGRGMAWLGESLGLEGLARLGKRWIGRAIDLAPGLGEAVLGRQEAAMRALLREFREGNLERALRRALPLGEPGGTRGGVADTGDRLPTQGTSYSLGDLLGSTGGRGPTALWYGRPDVMAELAREYRKAAQRAAEGRDFRRAAFIHGKLLKDYRAAANALIRGGLHHDAAILLLARLDDRRGAALAFEAAGEFDRAIGLFRALGDHVAAGDLLRKIGEEDDALVEYRRAAELLAANEGGQLAAGDLLLNKVGDREPARARFAAGWARRPGRNAVSCGLRLLRLDIEAGDLDAVRLLVEQADGFFPDQGDLIQAGRFYNELAVLANLEVGDIPAARDALRDRALLGLANELRTRARPGALATELVATLSRRPDAWPAAVISDAEFAINAATRRSPLAPPDPDTVTDPAAATDTDDDPGVRKLRVGRGVVTAFCAATGSGHLFLGFEGGEVFAVRPEYAEVGRVSAREPAVTAMAVTHDGKSLVSLQSDTAGRGMLSTYEREPAGSYRALHGMSVAVRSEAQPGLTPILPGAVGDRLGLWNGSDLDILAVASLSIGRTMTPSSPGFSAPVLLIPWPGFDEDGEGFAAFAHDGRDWTLFDSEGAVLHKTRLNWRPSLPAANRLRSVPVSWMAGAPEQMEMAGLGGYGTLHWAAFHRGDGRLKLVAMSVTTEEDGGYLAASIVKPRLVAGVTRSRIDWLWGGPSKFTLRSSTRVALPSAVACVASPRTGELVVICGDGLLAIVPIPV